MQHGYYSSLRECYVLWKQLSMIHPVPESMYVSLNSISYPGIYNIYSWYQSLSPKLHLGLTELYISSSYSRSSAEVRNTVAANMKPDLISFTQRSV